MVDGMSVSFASDFDLDNKLLTSADIRSGPDAFMADLPETVLFAELYQETGMSNTHSTGTENVPEDSGDSVNSALPATTSSAGSDNLRERCVEMTDETSQKPADGSVAATRTRRKAKKRSLVAEIQYITCPSCGLSLNTTNLKDHLQAEIQKLDKLPKPKKSYDSSSNKKQASCSSELPVDSADTEPQMDSPTRYKSYLKIRTRRERRSLAKKKKVGVGEEEVRCPVCNENIIGTQEELTEHVNQCLIQQEDEGDELDVEGDEEGFEEYTWAGQTRIRASSMLEGGLAASGFQMSSVNDEDEDVNLDIDGDDCNVYGDSQYSEADLLPCSSEEPEEDKQRKALRNAVLRGDGSRVSRTIPSDRQRWQMNGTKSEDKRVQKDCEEDPQNSVESDTNKSEVIRSLKAKIREQEDQLQKVERPKCLICMDWYTKPLTSVQCWHVHCEECWLRTLGTKKLCPQCNMITSPTDLRRIYL